MAQPEFEMVATNGIHLRVALAGRGPLVVLVHGWPESWYSWRHQIPRFEHDDDASGLARLK